MSELSATPVEALMPPEVRVSESTTFLPSRSSIRHWGIKSALSLVDQGFTSLTGFAVNLLLARWLAPELYGAFALAFTAFLFVSGFQNVLLLEPLSVIGPARHAGTLREYFARQVIVHMVLVGAFSLIALTATVVFWRFAPRSPLVGAALGSALMLPFLLLFWLARRMCYVIQRPGLAVVGSTAYFFLVTLALFALHFWGIINPFCVFLLMGGGGLIAGCVLLRSVGVMAVGARSQGELSWRATLGENWIYGRWLVGSTVLSYLANQTQMFMVAGLLGLGAAGVLRAMQLPSLVMIQLTTAAGLLVLPALSYDFGHNRWPSLRRKAALVSFGLSGMALAFVALLAIFAAPLEHLLFKGKFAQYAWLFPVFALIPLVIAFTMGYDMTLRASQKPQFDLLANSVAAPIGVLSAIAFIHWWDLAGAVASMVASWSTYCLLVYVAFSRNSHVA